MKYQKFLLNIEERRKAFHFNNFIYYIVIWIRIGWVIGEFLKFWTEIQQVLRNDNKTAGGFVLCLWYFMR